MINQIHNENCIATMQRLPQNYIDCVVTSPPYDNLRAYTGEAPWNWQVFQSIAKHLWRVVKPGGVVVWVVGDQTADGNESGSSFQQALFFKEVGFKLFDTMIYAKPPRGAKGSNKSYWEAFEYMFVFSKGLPKTTNFICDRPQTLRAGPSHGVERYADGKLKRKKRTPLAPRAFGKRTNIWTYNNGRHHSTKDAIAYKHPAIFPEALAADHIKSWTNEGDVVYDPFTGSGTTLKMAKCLKRQWIGSEISAEYCKIAESRLQILI